MKQKSKYLTLEVQTFLPNGELKRARRVQLIDGAGQSIAVLDLEQAPQVAVAQPAKPKAKKKAGRK